VGKRVARRAGTVHGPHSHPGRAARLALAVLLPLVLAPAAHPCDSTACLLQTRGSNGVPQRGRWQLDLSFRYTDQSVGMEGRHAVEEVRRPWIDFERQHVWPGFHQERQGLERFYQLDVVYGVGWQSAVQVSVPLYSRRRYSIVHGSAAFSYLTDGPGDAVVGWRRALGSKVVAGLALKLPSGRSDVQDPFGVFIVDPMIQPGTGSWDVVGSVQYGYRLAGFDGTLSGSYQRASTNSRSYRFGADLVAGASLRRKVAGPVSASLQLKGVHKDRSAFLGETVPSTGGEIVYLNPGVQVSLPRRGSAYAFLQHPLYRHVNEQQLTPRFSLLLGLSKGF
jgi:hypothetical protein